LTNIAADAAFLAAPSPIEVHPPRDSLALHDDDLLPTSVTPSPEPPAMARLPEVDVASTAPPSTGAHDEVSGIPAHDPSHVRDASLDSLSTILTDSSFHSPEIETAFLTSPPLDRGARRRTQSLSQRSAGRESARAVMARHAEQFAFTRSPPSGRRSPPPPSSSRSRSPLPPSPQLPNDHSFSPPTSPPLPPTRSSSGRASRTSERTSSRFGAGTGGGKAEARPAHRPAPLSLHKTPPMPSFEDAHGDDDDVVAVPRAPTPKSARRAGVVLGLDAAVVFPHRADGHGLPSALVGAPSPRSPSTGTSGWAKARGRTAPGGIGLMRNVAMPSPVSPATGTGDLDRLLDNLASMGAELDIP
jgi:hypothetical protein